MKIKVKLFGIFRNYALKDHDGYSFWMEFEDGAKLGDVLDTLGIPEEEPKALIRNHRAGEKDQVLEDGDTVAVFPPVAGGSSISR